MQRHYFASKGPWFFLWSVFPVVMYGCESWTVNKAERQRIDAFELWCWRRLLRVPWTAGKSNQSILKEIRPECSFEGLMLKLKLQYFGHLIQRLWWESLLTGKDSDARKDWRQEEKRMTEDEMVGWHHWFNGHELEQALGVGDGQEAWHAAVHGVAKSQTQLSNWTELNWCREIRMGILREFRVCKQCSISRIASVCVGVLVGRTHVAG